ncbi:hypothetical protein RB195_025230 [Necator americanus]|uniref:Transposase n=1 Tax=Necator americanus TaxID=51031 RepID=A0ABR1ERF4_NECAM
MRTYSGRTVPPKYSSPQFVQEISASKNKKLEDEPRSGRPTAISVDELKNLAEQHPYEGVRYFAASLGCSLSTVSNGLRFLRMVKKLGQWLPHALGDGNRQRRLDICCSPEARGLDTIVTGDEKWVLYVNHTQKQEGNAERLVGSSWNLLLPDNTTVTAEVYCSQLQRLADKICKKHPKLDNVRLLHDSARSHIAKKKTSQKILELGWEVLPHPAYSAVLAPSDYHLFRSLQHHLKEKRYDDRDHLENDLWAFFTSKSPEFYGKEIRDLVRRWQKLVDVDGDYFVE